MDGERNVIRITHRELDEILDVHYRTKIPLFLLGYAGTGKSQHIRRWAERKAKELGKNFQDNPKKFDPENDFLFLDFRASQIEPSDIRGLPFPDDGHVTWKIPDFLPEGEKAEGVIFLDELNHAPPSVLHALYQLILDRKVGESYKLPDGILVIGAGNYASEDEFLTDMPAPLRNRMSIYELGKPSVDEWVEWAVQNNIDSRIIAFLKKFPQYLHTWSDEGNPYVFATPRSWERVSKKIKGVNDTELIYILSAGDVGMEVASTFKKFVEETMNIPELDEVIKNPALLDKIQPHVAIVYSGAVAEMWKKGEKEKTAKAMDILLQKVPEAGIITARVLKSIDPVSISYIAQKISKEAYNKLLKILDISG